MKLKMEGIRKEFPGVVAVDEVDLVISDSEIHAIVGENGAGKSTLVKIITGVYKPDKGRILINDVELDLNNPNYARENGISIIFQEFNLCPELSVGENIWLGHLPCKKNQRVDWGELVEKSVQLLNKLDAPIPVSVPASELSVSEQQIVEIAKALSHDCKLLIMDEPTSALGQKETEVLFKIIKDLKKQGISVIFISHKLSEIFEIADKITVLRDGKKIVTTDKNNTTEEEIVTMMIGQSLNSYYGEKREEKPSYDNVPLLRIKNLNRGNKLRNIAFDLFEGEILGVYGLLGAGKTELLRALFGVDHIDNAIYELEGRNIFPMSIGKALRGKIGFVTEDRKIEGLYLDHSVEFNVTIAILNKIKSILWSVNKNTSLAITKKYVEQLSIKTPSIDTLLNTLSGGNQQKVVLAKWLASESKILLLDQPTRGIDVGVKREIYLLMQKLADNGVGIIFVSSELPEILNVSDRILVMAEGMILGEVPQEKASEELIIKIMSKDKGER